MTLGSSQPLTEMSTRISVTCKGRPGLKADNFTPSVSRLSRECGSLEVSQPYGTPRPVTGTALLSFNLTLSTVLQKTYFLARIYIYGPRLVSTAQLPDNLHNQNWRSVTCTWCFLSITLCLFLDAPRGRIQNERLFRPVSYSLCICADLFKFPNEN
jgi:hypothetical protein